jgi:hypothetical protein
MLPSMKERQASGADSLVIWRSKQRRTQQLQIPDLPIEYQYHCLMCLLRDEEVTTFEAALEKDNAVSRKTHRLTQATTCSASEKRTSQPN